MGAGDEKVFPPTTGYYKMSVTIRRFRNKEALFFSYLFFRTSRLQALQGMHGKRFTANVRKPDCVGPQPSHI